MPVNDTTTYSYNGFGEQTGINSPNNLETIHAGLLDSSGVSIDERPAEVDTRTVPGHWEGDQIKGEKNRSEVGVLLDRQSRRVVLARLTDARAETVREAFEATLRITPPELSRP